MNTKARDEIAAGFRYAHFRADANTCKLLEVASFFYAAIDLLSQKGLLDIAELDERKKVTAAQGSAAMIAAKTSISGWISRMV